MSVKLGTTDIVNFKAGTTQVNKIYLGTNLVWEYSTGSAGFDADWQAVLDEGTTQGYTLPSAAVQTASNQLVLDLKSAGLWSKFDLLYVFATDGDSDFACINWASPGNYTAEKVNSPIFSSSEGFGSNGSAYMNTYWAPAFSASNFTTASACFGVYERIEDSNVNIRTGVIGDAGSTNNRRIFVRPNSGGTLEAELGTRRNSVTYPTTTSSLGLTHIELTPAAGIEFYQNGVLKGTDTSITLQGFPDDNPLAQVMIMDCAMVLAGGQLNQQAAIGESQISMIFYAAGMTGSVGTFFNIFNDYMTTLGTNVV